MKITVSAGLAIIKGQKILLGHPTRGPWTGRHSIPKGQIENGETIMDTAIRETQEEVGITLTPEQIEPTMYSVSYTDKNGRPYKVVHYFVARVAEQAYPDILPKEQLQTQEIDWAGFLPWSEAAAKIFWRFEPLLKLIE